jgi:toxin ParE1/3/4
VGYKIAVTPSAVADLDEIVAYICDDNPSAGMRFEISLLDHIRILEFFPLSGRLVAKRPAIRRLVHDPVSVYYRVREEDHLIEIVHIRHNARKPPRF